MLASVLILCLLSVVCFLAATLGATLRNYNLVALGLLFFALVPLVELVAENF